MKNRIAVLIPCYNEESTIEKVIKDFKQTLPEARIIVFDNNCTDKSIVIAKNNGAEVIREKRQGKGYVVSSMLSKIEADYFVMVDGDDTYPAEKAIDLLKPIIDEEADMVVAQRLTDYEEMAYRPFHIFGNRLVCWLINLIFKSNLRDPMSGFRAYTREVANSIPILSQGFDVETEMTLQMLYRYFMIKEIPIVYRARPHGSISKLNTFRDGFKVLTRIFNLFRTYKPLTFFGLIAIFFFICGGIIGISAFIDYAKFGYSITFTQVILVSSSIIAAVISASIGLIINSINMRLLELSAIIIRNTNHKE